MKAAFIVAFCQRAGVICLAAFETLAEIHLKIFGRYYDGGPRLMGEE